MADKDLIPTNNNVALLDENYLSKLETWEDHLSFYIQLEETETAYSWLKADTLLQMTERFGDMSLQEVSRATGKPLGTVINYVRTSRAFPPDKREPAAPFSLHYQASYADSFDDKDKVFKTDHRFEWIQKAVENHMPTRALAEAIRKEKISEINEGTVVNCEHCRLPNPTKEYVVYTPGEKGQERFDLCDDCFVKLKAFAHGLDKDKSD